MPGCLATARRRRRQLEGTPIRHWTDAQQRFYDSPYRLTVWWGGNGIGKSIAVAELVRRALCGLLHWQTPGRPQVVILAGNTWMQLGATLEYLWNSEFRGWLRPGVRYESGSMKGQRLQVFDIVAGPGKGSTLRCGTFLAENLAGPRADVVITDEPLPQDVYDELWPRLFGRNGRMYQTFTVTLGTTTKLNYLWKLVDSPDLPWAGQIQTELTMDAVTPRGSGFELPWYSPQELREAEEGISGIQRDMRMGRTRTPLSGAAYFQSWGPHLIGPCTPPPGTPLGVGLDHGSKPGAQRAVLVAVGGHGPAARVWILDEFKADGRTESEEDARGILEMIRRNGYELADIDLWYGDRSHRGDSRGGKKSNQRLIRSMAQHLGISLSARDYRKHLPEAFRRIRTPYKTEGSVWDGMEVLHRLMVGDQPRITMAEGLGALNHDLSTWEGSLTAPEKDGIDALRYIVVPMTEREEPRAPWRAQGRR